MTAPARAALLPPTSHCTLRSPHERERAAPAGSIAVGVDGSACAGLALDWAVAEATRRRLPLHIVHAFSYQYPMTSQGGMGFVIEGVREIAEELCQKAMDRRASTATPT